MAAFGLRTVLRNFFWRSTRPPEVFLHREGQEEEEAYKAEAERRNHQAREIALRLRQGQEERRSLVDDPNMSGDALRRLVNEDARIWNQAKQAVGSLGVFERGIIEDMFDPNCRLREDFQAAVSAHSNLPPELFGRELPVIPSSVEGLLSNPICPLLLLERPDFVETLDQRSQLLLAHLTLQRAAVPRALLCALINVSEPWLALEVRTHVAAEFPDVPTVPDMEWLDTQVVNLLRDDALHRRCLVYELACHGLLAHTIEPKLPWQHSDASVSNDAALPPTFREFVRKTRWLAWRKPEEREWWLGCWLYKHIPMRELTCAEVLRLETALFHPKTARWVGEVIARGWPEDYPDWSLYRLLTMRQGKAKGAVMVRHREAAIRNALHCWISGPGIFYFVMRNLPNPLEGAKLVTPHHVPGDGADLRKEIKEMPFLLRLAIVLRLDDVNAEQKELREMLLDDPNRYVRAAARKEIAWPKPAG